MSFRILAGHRSRVPFLSILIPRRIEVARVERVTNSSQVSLVFNGNLTVVYTMDRTLYLILADQDMRDRGDALTRADNVVLVRGNEATRGNAGYV